MRLRDENYGNKKLLRCTIVTRQSTRLLSTFRIRCNNRDFNKKTSLETCIRVCVLCVNACVTTAVSHDYDERSRGDFHRQTYVDLSDGTACKKFNRRNASLLRLIEECQPFDTSYRPCVSSSVIYTCPTKDNPLTLQAIIFFISTLRRGESRGSYAHRINICD